MQIGRTLVLLLATTLAAVAAPAALEDVDFKTWEVPVAYTHVYHVAQQAANASDNNPGTAEQPFRTIQRAANVLQPGERVLIHDGVYRECVDPPRGGTGPDKLISYEAAPDAHPVITGTEVFRGPWQPATDWPKSPTNNGTVWVAQLPPTLFIGGNPFSEMQVMRVALQRLMNKGKKLEHLPIAKTLSRGMIFEKDRRWTQVESFAAVNTAPAGGVFWAEENGLRIYARAFGDADPNGLSLEITTRSACFAPTERNLGYLRLNGLTFQCASDVRGMIQENAGHHWLITSNIVRDANCDGVRLGRDTFADRAPAELGEDIVRGNTISACGQNGIGGMGCGGEARFAELLEGNVLQSNCWQDIEAMFDSAAIKLLITHGTVIRDNLITDTLHGSAIWLDWQNRGSRCSSNTIINTTCSSGAIFLEACVQPNLVDHNIVWNTKPGAGIYEHDCNDQVIVSNFVGRSTGPGIFLHGKISNRVVGGVPVKGGHHHVTDNILYENGEPIKALGVGNLIENNITNGITAAFDPVSDRVTWSRTGQP